MGTAHFTFFVKHRCQADAPGHTGVNEPVAPWTSNRRGYLQMRVPRAVVPVQVVPVGQWALVVQLQVL